MADVVSHAGGWLFDRVMAGWDVTVLVADSDATRPLDILGVRVVDLEAGLARREGHPMPQSLALDAQLYATEPRVRERLRHVLEHELSEEVTLWGDGVAVDRPVDSVRHPLSYAARAFKAQAMAAMAAPGQVDPAELFHSCDLRNGYREFRDLVPVS